VVFIETSTCSQVEVGRARDLNAVASKLGEKADLSKFSLKQGKLSQFQKFHWHNLSVHKLWVLCVTQYWGPDKEYSHPFLPVCSSLLQLEISM